MTDYKKTDRFGWTLQAKAYFDPDVYAKEQHKVFHNAYVYALHASQLPEPGSYQALSFGDSEVLVIRGMDNQIRAFHNVCVHRGHLLVSRGSKGCKRQLICPYHAWQYSTDGALKHAEGVNIQALPDGHRGLRPIEYLELSGFIFVRNRPAGAADSKAIHAIVDSLKSTVPNLERLKVVRSVTQSVNANWKIMIENYLECYHCRPTHPALVDLMDMDSFQIALGNGWSSSKARVRNLKNKAFTCRENFMDQREFTGWWLWPNLTFNVFPGEQNLLIFHIRPTGPETCVGICDFLFVDGKVSEQAESLMEWETTVLEAEDNELVESAHHGMKSGALEYGILVDHEAGCLTERAVAHFLDAVTTAMDDGL
jgi:carnitine monooxygenase subunit